MALISLCFRSALETLSLSETILLYFSMSIFEFGFPNVKLIVRPGVNLFLRSNPRNQGGCQF